MVSGSHQLIPGVARRQPVGTGELKEHLSVLVKTGPDRSDPKEASLLFRRFLDWMVRIREGTTAHYPTPSKALETDISPGAYERYKTCTAILGKESLEDAYSASWLWGPELMSALSRSCTISKPETVMARLDERFSEWFAEKETPDKMNRQRP